MDPELASKKGLLVEIETPGGVRIAAHVFTVPGGFVFADIGWNAPLLSSNPFHFVQCEIVKGGYLIDGRYYDIYISEQPYPSERGDRDSCRKAIQDAINI